jgi:3-methyladenine DNA glycosylase AlkD
MTSDLLEALRLRLAHAADPDNAPRMQAYMKSSMPYHGVTLPRVREICRDVFERVEFRNAAAWSRAVRAIWRQAAFREERYGAIALSGHKAAAAFQTLDALPLYEEMIVTGAWWDYVDDIAEHRVGPIVLADPASMKPAMRTWSVSPHMWKRRTSIICQNAFKEETDEPLLLACIEPSVDSKEFFLRKAIGWSLRMYARIQPRRVLAYVRANRNRLSPLSKREALKALLRAGTVPAVP